MDDYIHSLLCVDEAIETINQKKIPFLKVALVQNVVWSEVASSELEALKLSEQGYQDELKETNRLIDQKWYTRTDCFLLKTSNKFPRHASMYTQKGFSFLSTNCDPGGILSALTIRIKTFLQQVWIGMNHFLPNYIPNYETA